LTLTAAGGSVRVQAVSGQQSRSLSTPIHVRRRDGAFHLVQVGATGLKWAVDQLRITPGGGQPLGFSGGQYPGSMVAVATPQKAGPSRSRFDLVNHVALERYLPGVLAKELYPNWDAAAFRAQAVAARSYALFEAWENRRRHYDLTSTTASQVYAGQTTNPRAVEAARTTAGEVMTYRDRVLPGYYSSSCGGTSQSAWLAFDAGWQVQPLGSRSHESWCRASSKYRWGPIDRRTSDLAWRINQWGDANNRAIGRLEGLRSIVVSKRSEAGRPAVFTLTDRRGQAFQLRCESFRFACNYDRGKLSDLPQAKRLLSSHVQIAVNGETTRFDDGRGFGHGVGLCQWGAQGMAKAGYAYQTILKQFYASASLQRLY
jgi:stage II sporulation protein D